MRGLKIQNEMTFSEHKPLTLSLIFRKTNDGKKENFWQETATLSENYGIAKKDIIG